MVERLSKMSNFGGQLNDDYDIHDDYIASIMDLDVEKKVISIYNLVRDTYTCNRVYSNFTSDSGISGLIKSKSGNSADINLLLVDLLKKAEVDVFPLVMRNRYTGFLNIANPSLDDLNYVMAVVQLGENIIYLDATEKGLQAGMLPGRALNLKGVAIVDGQGSEIPIINTNAVLATDQIKLSISPDNHLSGSIISKHKNYGSYILRSNYSSADEVVNYLAKERNAKLSNVITAGFTDNSNSISINADFKSNFITNELDGKLFIPFSLGQGITNSPYKADSRSSPLHYDYLLKNVTNVSLAIPEGYKVESMPEKLLISLPEQIMTFQIEGRQIGDNVVVTIRHKRNSNLISDEYYLAIKSFYEQAIEKSNEMIVLTKM